MSKKAKAPSLPAYDSLFFSRSTSFLDTYLERQAGRSPYTRKSYKSGLSSFYDYVVDVLRIPPAEFLFAQCSYQLVLGYSQYLQETLKRKNSTVNSKLAAIKAYLEYAADCDASVISVYVAVSRVPMLTVPKVQQPIIQTGDLAEFLGSPEHTRIGNRDRFMLIFLYDSAVRVSELVGITLGDVVKDGGDYTVLIHGKGRKERCIVLSEKTCRHMRNYLETYHGGTLTASRPLFYTKQHGGIHHMSVRNVERILNKYGAKTRQNNPGIPDSVTPHTVRRSRATTLYRDGVPIEQVSAFIGHSQIETTRTHYASPSPEQLKSDVEKGSKYEPDQVPEWLGHTDDIKRRFGLA